jgi:hypothetical protein
MFIFALFSKGYAREVTERYVESQKRSRRG